MPRWDAICLQQRFAIARINQSELARQNQPWKHSSGPKSQYGKWVSSKNARKGKLHQSASFVSPSQRCDKEPEPSPDESSSSLAVGDYVIYVGDWAPTLQQCRGEPMMVLGFSNGAVACHLKGEISHVIWIYSVDLQRVNVTGDSEALLQADRIR